MIGVPNFDHPFLDMFLSHIAGMVLEATDCNPQIDIASAEADICQILWLIIWRFSKFKPQLWWLGSFTLWYFTDIFYVLKITIIVFHGIMILIIS